MVDFVQNTKVQQMVQSVNGALHKQVKQIWLISCHKPGSIQPSLLSIFLGDKSEVFHI